jgi:diaminohydroxyphosphoribosylaminopyrimidine deaminase/5-amino-6-(5-phosphoribosylamino)uracil reductase
LQAEAAALNAGFFLRMRQGRPFVRLKSAASLDGRTALANGDSQWITSEEARADVQHWRAQSGAILTSAATVLADDPRMNVRIEAPHQPLRVVLDRRRQVPASARILRAPGEVLLFAAAPAARARKAREPAREKPGRARLERVRVLRGHLDLRRVLARLAELEVNDLLVESGPRLAGALLAAGLVDEWVLYIAPKLLGADARPLASIERLRKLAAAPRFEVVESRQVGPDIRLRLQPRARKS